MVWFDPYNLGYMVQIFVPYSRIQVAELSWTDEDIWNLTLIKAVATWWLSPLGKLDKVLVLVGSFSFICTYISLVQWPSPQSFWSINRMTILITTEISFGLYINAVLCFILLVSVFSLGRYIVWSSQNAQTHDYA